MLGIMRVFVVRPAPSSTSTHPNVILAGFSKEFWKGKWDEKRSISRSTIQSSFLQVFQT